MDEKIFNYQFSGNAVIFTDSIKTEKPCVFLRPRNHDSIFFVTKGSLLYEKENISEIINEGQVGYIAKGSVDKSSAYLCDEVSYIATNFNFDNDNSITDKDLPFNALCSKGLAYNYERLFNDALTVFLSQSPGYMTVFKGILMQIIGHLYNEFRVTDINNRKMKKIQIALEYLRVNYNCADFKIRELAEKTFMSEKNFRRLFFEVYKKNPYEFLQEYRINKAKILLLSTNKSISDIATECGFSDVYAFSHSFKRHIGLSPSKFRIGR